MTALVDPSARTHEQQDLRWGGVAELIALGMTIAIAVTVVVVYGTKQENPGQVIALSSLMAAGAFASAGVLGFLFALPRSRTVIAEPTRSEAGGRRPLTVAPNTNLEDVSDWVTKIIVGLTLTQVGNIPDGAARLFNSLGGALGESSQNPTFVGSLLIFCSAMGFVLGWLTTRMYVNRWMTASDRPVFDDLAP